MIAVDPAELERLRNHRAVLAMLLASFVFLSVALMFALYAEPRREPAPQIHSVAPRVSAN